MSSFSRTAGIMLAVSLLSVPASFLLTPERAFSQSPAILEDGSYNVGPHPWEVLHRDLNNDGHEDLVTNASGGNAVEILLGNGDGTFQEAVPYWAGYVPLSIVSDDFDEDGNFDLAVSSTDSDLVVILPGRGDGTLGDSVVYPAGDFPENLTSGDVNNDGHVDLMTSNAYSNDVGVYLGDGRGSFEGPHFYPIAGGPRSPELGDFNEDGNLDVVLSLRGALDLLGIMFGDGTGAFPTTVSFHIGQYPKESSVGDYNGDGHLDIAIACRIESAVKVIYGDGTGAFSDPDSLPVGTGPRWVIHGDADNDGVNDLITTNYFGNSISIMLGDGAGGFLPRRDFSTRQYPRGLTIGDFDSDGKPDLAIASFGQDKLSIILDITAEVTPYLISPPDSAVLTGDPVFEWKEVSGADAYQLVLFDSGGQLVWSKFLQDQHLVPYDGTVLLTQGASYDWSVRERVQNEWHLLAPLFSFQKELPESLLAAPLLNLPADGDTLALPELFSWSALGGAARYEISVFDDSAATVLLYHGTTEDHSHSVPSGVSGMSVLKDYYWKVRGIDSRGYAGAYSLPRRFNLTDLVPAPDPPLLISPQDADTVRQSTITFVWYPSSGATHYRLEFSRTPFFFPSSDSTWSAERIPDSLYTTQLREGASSLYWRVMAVNSAGGGPWSEVIPFTYDGGGVPPIRSVEILEPPQGAQVELGSSIMPVGMISGSHSGTVEGAWLLNGAVLDSFSVTMNPANGVEVSGPVIKTGSLGLDTLSLSVSSPETVSSQPLLYHVVLPTSGEVTGIHLVASPFAIPADSQSQSTVTAIMVDSEGRRVYADYARLVSFVVLGGGFPVGPTAGLTDSGEAQITVQSTNTPDPDVLVLAFSPGIEGDYTYFMTYDQALEEYVTRTLAHIGRLEQIPLDYYPSRFDTTASGYDLSAIWDFLNNRILGISDPSPEDVESLKRLMLGLRFLDMCDYYRHDPLFPEEDLQPLLGTGSLLDDISDASSGAAIVSVFFAHTADTILQRAGTSPQMARVSRSVLTGSERLFDGVFLPVAESGKDPVRTGRVLRALRTSHREAAAHAREGGDPEMLTDNYTVRLDRQFEFLNDYVADTQYLVDSIGAWAQSNRYLMTFEEARDGVNDVLSEVRARTRTASLAIGGYDLDGGLSASSRQLSLLAGALTQGFPEARLIANLRESSGYVALPEKWHSAGQVPAIAAGALDEVQPALLPDGVWTSFGLVPGNSRPNTGRVLTPLGSDGVERIQSVILSLIEKETAFESTTNGILASLSSDDSLAVADHIEELCERGDAILELMYILRATFGSFSAGARGAVGDFDVLYEDMNAAYLDVSSVITSFELSLLDYFANREYDYAKSAAIQSGYDAITGMSGAVTRYSHTLPSFFDVPAAPALVPLGISFPDSVGPSRIFRVDAYLLNTGSGIASDVSVALSFEGPFDFLTADTITVASLAPGDSTHLSWQMRVKPPGHAGLMRGLYSCSMEPYSSDSFSYPRFFFLRTYKKNFGVNFAALKKGPEGDVSLRSVPKIYFLYQNSPNPFNPQTSIAFDIAGDEPQRVNLRIYDLRGRLLVTLVDQMKAPGRYRISWDGRDGDGRLLGTGIYFYVIDAGSFRSVRKMILRK